jgi:5'-3' exoribonuclease 2
MNRNFTSITMKMSNSDESNIFTNQSNISLVKHYVEGLCWVLLYYYQGCASWTWYFPYHFAPFASDFQDISTVEVTFEKGQPFKPAEQLMGVLPAASKTLLPEAFQALMVDEDSSIIDFYPEDFQIDMNGKKVSWQGVALLSFIDEERLLSAMEPLWGELSEEERIRNEMGNEILFVAQENKLYDDLGANFYAMKEGVEVYPLNLSC